MLIFYGRLDGHNVRAYITDQFEGLPDDKCSRSDQHQIYNTFSISDTPDILVEGH